jgi:hypothetical protein
VVCQFKNGKVSSANFSNSNLLTAPDRKNGINLIPSRYHWDQLDAKVIVLDINFPVRCTNVHMIRPYALFKMVRYVLDPATSEAGTRRQLEQYSRPTFLITSIVLLYCGLFETTSSTIVGNLRESQNYHMDTKLLAL